MPQKEIKYIFGKKTTRFLLSILDRVGKVFSSPFSLLWLRKLPSPSSLKKPKRIILVRLDHIGDVLFVTPAIRTLKRGYPEAKLSFLGGSWAKEILEKNPWLDEIIVFDAPWIKEGRMLRLGLREILSQARILRKKRFDLGVAFRPDFHDLWLLWLGKVKWRVGYGAGGGGFLLTHPVPYRFNIHEIERNLALVKALGIEVVSKNPEVFTDERDRKKVEKLLREFRIKKEEFLIAIHPGARTQVKRWGEGKFAQLIDKINLNFLPQIILVGGKEERPLAEEVRRRCKIKPLNLCGLTSLRELFLLFKKCKLFIGGDSAPLHLAAAAGIWVVGIFSGVNRVSEFGAFTRKRMIIQKTLSCSPCRKTYCAHPRCLKEIGVEEVYQKVEKVINENL